MNLRTRLSIIVVFATVQVFGQGIDDWVKKLKSMGTSDMAEVKELADKIYAKSPYNKGATMYLCSVYSDLKMEAEMDSIFERMFRRNPKHPLPHLLRAQYQYRTVNLSDTLRINELAFVLSRDPNHLLANSMLAGSYYQLFRAAHKEGSGPVRYYASKGKAAYLKSMKMSPDRVEESRYPLIQLANFLGQQADVSNYVEYDWVTTMTKNAALRSKSILLMPLEPFIDLGDNWQTNYGKDVVEVVNDGKFVPRQHARIGLDFGEKNILSYKNTAVFRFTWLRTYSDPFVFRIWEQQGLYKLEWKTGKFATGSRKGKASEQETITLTRDQWREFERRLVASKFFDMPTVPDNWNNHKGGKWIFEGKRGAEFNMAVRKIKTGTEFEKVVMYLVELAGVEDEKTEE